MAFGISGSDTRTNMVGADVVVTWINSDGPNAVDYYLTARQQVQLISCIVDSFVMFFVVILVQGWGGSVP